MYTYVHKLHELNTMFQNVLIHWFLVKLKLVVNYR